MARSITARLPYLPMAAEALADAATAAPPPEAPRDELTPVVRDQVVRLTAGNPDRPFQESTYGLRGRLPAEELEPHHPSGVVVDGDAHPPAEGPGLRQGVGHPRDPET
jgi:hypothetical protein